MARQQPSIRQNSMPAALPDPCTPSTALRILLAVNVLAAAGLMVRQPTLQGFGRRMLDAAAWVEPILFVTLLALCCVRPLLNRLDLRHSATIALAIVALCAWGTSSLIAAVLGSEDVVFTAMLWSVLLAAVIFYWLVLLQRSRSPALAEARLMALSARIRPHFLFNSLNAILGVIRSEPRRAEAAIEELADLFRALMKDPRDLVLLSDEIALARRYLELERLRLGDRLLVQWDITSCPPDALMPPLMLQPLLENAVYHGIEPGQGPGQIRILLARIDRQVLIELSNPLQPGHVHAKGNQMALGNIRERLQLFFDLEGGLQTEVGSDRYTVRIHFPYRNR